MLTITQTTFSGILVLEIGLGKTDNQYRTSNIANSLFDLVSKSPCHQVLLDLKGVAFITSDVIGQLIMLNRKCQAQDRQLKLCGVSEVNRTALEVVRFDALADIYDHKPQAIAAFKIDAQKPVQVETHYGDAEENRRLGESGDLDAQFRYGKCLETGQGVDQDFGAALQWFQRAANQGHAESQHAVAVAYAYGIGVDQNLEKAFRWYLEAADRGHADAQYMMGISWHYGLMDKVDHQRALKWYTESAEQGYPPAQEAMQELKRESLSE